VEQPGLYADWYLLTFCGVQDVKGSSMFNEYLGAAPSESPRKMTWVKIRGGSDVRGGDLKSEVGERRSPGPPI